MKQTILRTKHAYYALTISTALLSSCMLGPDYTAPESAFNDAPMSWGAGDGQDYLHTQGAIEQAWWKQVNDPILNQLVEQAMHHNLELRSAQANLERSDALISQAQSGLLPTLDAEGSKNRTQISENAGIPVGPQNPRIQNFYDSGLISSWELDVFGGLRREVAAAYARYENQQEQRRDLVLVVLSEVANHYIELRSSQRNLEIIQENIDLLRSTTKLVGRRYEEGEVSEFDYSRSLAELQSTEARLPNIEASIQSTMYRLSVLTGHSPEHLLTLLQEVKPLPEHPNIVRIGMPSDLLRRRPDVRAAERILAAETEEIGARIADLFPKFSLTGSIGYESIGSDQLTASSSRTWAIGPSVSWPIFAAGRIRAQIGAEEADAKAAAYDYEHTVLLALEDAQAALIQYAHELDTKDQRAAAVETRRHNVTLAKKRYVSGLDSLISYMDTQRQLLTSEEELLQAQTDLLLKLVRLYKSLGGGWELSEATAEDDAS